MVNINSTLDAIKSLTPDQIRQRIDEIDAERKALMTLLRASMHTARKPSSGGAK